MTVSVADLPPDIAHCVNRYRKHMLEKSAEACARYGYSHLPTELRRLIIESLPALASEVSALATERMVRGFMGEQVPTIPEERKTPVFARRPKK